MSLQPDSQALRRKETSGGRNSLHAFNPDEHGFCSYGISVDYTKPAAENSKMIIAEVTPHMPRTLGNSFIHVSRIDCIVETDSKPIALTPPRITPNDEKIGQYCAELIRDGDCLQLGIGAVPDAVLCFLKHKKDLGIHTEMFSDGVVDLVNSGVITCARKNYHPGKMVATFFMGSEKLYRFVNNNPMVEMYPVDYTNNPAIIARNDNMVSINSALQVDLLGQAVSDMIGFRQFSGSGDREILSAGRHGRVAGGRSWPSTQPHRTEDFQDRPGRRRCGGNDTPNRRPLHRYGIRYRRAVRKDRSPEGGVAYFHSAPGLSGGPREKLTRTLRAVGLHRPDAADDR